MVGKTARKGSPQHATNAKKVRFMLELSNQATSDEEHQVNDHETQNNPSRDSRLKNNKGKAQRKNVTNKHRRMKLKENNAGIQADAGTSLKQTSVEIKGKKNQAEAASNQCNTPGEVTCKVCERTINSLVNHNEEPKGGFEESAAILDSKLLLFDEDGVNVSNEDTRSYNKITSFSLYCKNGHLCSLDSGLIEKDREIYFSGYVKPIHSDDPSPEKDSVPGKRFGPIGSWWITGFDIGEQPTVGLSTELGDYICMEPSPEYAPFMRSVLTIMYISKTVIEFLIYHPNASYEDLLSKLQTTPELNRLVKNFTEDTLLHCASFVCSQVITFDDTAKPKEQLMVTIPCIRRLINLAGIKFEIGAELPQEHKQVFQERQFEHKINYREKLLRQVAEDKEEISDISELIEILLPTTHEKFLTSESVELWRCGVCERCSRSRCRDCKACSAGKACYQRRCFSREIKEENEQDAQDEVDFSEIKADDSFSLYRKAVRPLSSHNNDIAWGTKLITRDQNRMFYGSMYVNCQLISPGDFIETRSENEGVPPQIMKVSYMYEDEEGFARIHACFLWSGKYTVLGDISDPKELFFINRCIDVKARCIVKKVHVFERTSANLDDSLVENQIVYVCQRSYDTVFGTFYDLDSVNEGDRNKYGAPHRYCAVCDRNNVERMKYAPTPLNKIDESKDKITYESVQYRDENYCVGSTVYLKPKSLYFKYPMFNNLIRDKSSLDEEKYTEIYRKTKDEDTNLNRDVQTLFDIGYIKEIAMYEGKLNVEVIKLYRPENTHMGEKLKNTDINLLFWSDEHQTLPFNCVVAKCYAMHSTLIADVDEWSRQGPDRFYFSQIYTNNKIRDIGMGEYDCPNRICDAPRYPDAKLKTLNIFAGCGGLSLGLQQAGVSECKWAVEPDKAAAMTFKLNNPGTAVFAGTCVQMMEKFSKEDYVANDDRLPKRGNVDLLCATLPSENWRSINSVDAFKGSNIAIFLAYLQLYQPPYFVLDTDDVLLKRSIVLKLALASFIRLGYQVAFDLMQVGNFGAPQDRCRTVIIGASRGYTLPDCPKSQHVFSKSSCHGCFVIDKKMYQRRNWSDSAPYRAITVLDAISDLSTLDVDRNEQDTLYKSRPAYFYQRNMRYSLTESEKTKIRNHVGKDLGPLVHARMSQIPHTPGADWRDLPNIEFQLRDGTFTKKLIYLYNDPELGTSQTGQPRGVCSCSTGTQCKPSNVQENTLIPWHLVHSGKRHGHWAGLYSKLQWKGVFVGTSTNPEPLAKKAPVIHPSRSRVVSVRECARAQGFPDSFVFSGVFSVHEQYRQIGLSTSPLLARAIGHEIAKSVASNRANFF